MLNYKKVSIGRNKLPVEATYRLFMWGEDRGSAESEHVDIQVIIKTVLSTTWLFFFTFQQRVGLMTEQWGWGKTTSVLQKPKQSAKTDRMLRHVGMKEFNCC